MIRGIVRRDAWLDFPSGNGTAMGSTLTLATPSLGSTPIFCAVEGERSKIRPFTYGPRSSILTTALLPVSTLVTFAVVPMGRVLLAVLFSVGSMGLPLAILWPANRRAYTEALPTFSRPLKSAGNFSLLSSWGATTTFGVGESSPRAEAGAVRLIQAQYARATHHWRGMPADGGVLLPSALAWQAIRFISDSIAGMGGAATSLPRG